MEIDNLKNLMEDALYYIEKEIVDYLCRFIKQQDLNEVESMVVRDTFIRDLIKRIVEGSHYIIALEWGREDADKAYIEFLKELIEEVKKTEWEEDSDDQME